MADEKDKTTAADLVRKVESWYSYFSEHILRARNFQTFMYVDQWDADIRANREDASKPVLQANKLTSIMRAIVGSQRKNTPALDVRDITTDFQVPQQTIDILTDYIREIFYSSDADIVFQIAFRQLVECGWGAVRVITEYENANSFQQRIKIEPIVDFQAAFWDPTAQEADKSDGDFCGVHQVLSKDKFNRLYPNAKDTESVAGGADYYVPWTKDEAIVIAEIYVKEYFTKTIALLSNGQTMNKQDADELIEQQKIQFEAQPELQIFGLAPPLEIKDTRTVRDYKIMHYKFTHNEILEQTSWPGKLLPIPYGEGDSTIIQGRRMPLPFMQDTIDTQKFHNYIISEIAYAILLARKEKAMAPEECVEGYPEWRDPDNTKGVLRYKLGRNGEKPEFINPMPFSPELINLAQYTDQSVQQITGRYEEARGEESNALSGLAIAKRQEASNLPVNLYQDNLARMIRQIGKIILDILPKVIDNERNIMVRGADNKSRMVTVNKQSGYQYNAVNDDFDNLIQNDLSKGTYDVQVRVDGSFDQQKAAALEFLIRLSAINPAIANLIPDLIAENSGLENSQKLIERLKTLLPPQIQAQEDGKPLPPPQPPPPPDPRIVAAQLKAQTDMQANQLKQQQLVQERAQMMMNAQLKKLDYQGAITKSMAEIQKSRNAMQQAAIEHVTAVHNNASDMASKILEAETKHAALAAQSQELKQAGL
jgi:hypothetical protein